MTLLALAPGLCLWTTLRAPAAIFFFLNHPAPPETPPLPLPAPLPLSGIYVLCRPRGRPQKGGEERPPRRGESRRCRDEEREDEPVLRPPARLAPHRLEGETRDAVE